jgi:hypothetical protein
VRDLLATYGTKSAHELPPPPKPSGRKTKRPRGEARPFLRGPIPVEWLARAHEAGGAALAVGLSLWFVRGVSGKSGPVKMRAAVRSRFRLNPDQNRRGLRALEAAGLVELVKGGRGRCAVVEIVEGERNRPTPKGAS